MQNNNEIQNSNHSNKKIKNKVKKNYTVGKLTFQQVTLLALFQAYESGGNISMLQIARNLNVYESSISRCYKLAFKENFFTLDMYLNELASLNEDKEEIERLIDHNYPKTIKEINKIQAVKFIELLYKKFVEKNSRIIINKNHIREIGLEDIIQLLEKKSEKICLTDCEYNNVCTFLLDFTNIQINWLMTNLAYVQILAQIKEKSSLLENDLIMLNNLIQDLKKLVNTEEDHNQTENHSNIVPKKKYVRCSKSFQKNTLLQLFEAYGSGGLKHAQIAKNLNLKQANFSPCYQFAFSDVDKIHKHFNALASLDETTKKEIKKLIDNRYPDEMKKINKIQAEEYITELHKQFVKENSSIIFEKNDVSQINVASNKRKRETELTDIIQLLEKKSGGTYLTDQEYDIIWAFFLDSNENQIKLLVDNPFYSAILDKIKEKSPLLANDLIMLNNLIQYLKSIIHNEIPPRKKIKNNSEQCNSLNDQNNETYENFQNFEDFLNKKDRPEDAFDVNQMNDVFFQIEEVNNNQIINVLPQNSYNPNMYVHPMNPTSYNYSNVAQNPYNAIMYVDQMNNLTYSNQSNVAQNPNNPNIYISSMNQFPTFNSNNWNQGYQNQVNYIPFNNNLIFTVESQSNFLPPFPNEANLAYSSQFQKIYAHPNKNAFFNDNKGSNQQLDNSNSNSIFIYPFLNPSH